LPLATEVIATPSTAPMSASAIEVPINEAAVCPAVFVSFSVIAVIVGVAGVSVGA